MRTVLLLFIILACCALANSAPVVSSVTASQRTDGSGSVDIYYTLSDADGDKCTVSVLVSNDGGSTWTITPSNAALSGAVGSNINSGRKHILWASKTDLPGAFGSNYRVKITADDNYDPTGMTWVYINDPGVSGHEDFNGYMSKYETTNAQYCQYLNTAKAAGLITVYNNVVYATSDTSHSQPYYNLVGVGSDHDNATNGGAARINWTGGSFTVDSGFESHPVTYVSWYGAIAFCDYYGWRLPTEWEWQAVADYDGSFIWGCGITINYNMANYLGSAHLNGTTVVGAFGMYGYGIADMTGNVSEWSSNCYYADCLNSYRVVRGGGWLNASDLTISGRQYNYTLPNSMNPNHGFRVCR